MKPIERLMLHDWVILALALIGPGLLFVVFWKGQGQ